jgi:hypothetical protein
MQPLHAPVIGSGTATKSMRPIASYLWIMSPFALVLSKSQSKNFLQTGNRRRALETGSNRNRTGAIMTEFPSIDRMNAFAGGSPMANATGIEPLNSATGNVAMIMVVHSLGMSLKAFKTASSISKALSI